MTKRKEPTWTSLVLSALRANYNDFMSVKMLRAATGGSVGQVHAALHHMRASRVVDVVIEKDGMGWWFALPPEDDQRSRTLNERTPESKPRKQRASRAKVTAEKVHKVRDLSGCDMMVCKAALIEADGSVEGAAELLMARRVP